MHDLNALVGTHDLLFLTLDTLRYDVAREELEAGRTPTLAALLPGGRWEERHSPASFTYAAHQAFFAGFLPTPVT
ncbi:metalloenzyme domain-containing protein, partial [Corallococcus sp. AB050B]